jgi:hypothetical protein
LHTTNEGDVMIKPTRDISAGDIPSDYNGEPMLKPDLDPTWEVLDMVGNLAIGILIVGTIIFACGLIGYFLTMSGVIL